MSKPGPISAKPLSVLLSDVFSDAYAKQGFAARELVTRWAEIAGPEVAAHSRAAENPVAAPGRGPAARNRRRWCCGWKARWRWKSSMPPIMILQRVNRFFGWSAVGRLALRQAPLSRRDKPKTSRAPDPAEVAELEKTLSSVEDEELRTALARLGASIKRN